MQTVNLSKPQPEPDFMYIMDELISSEDIQEDTPLQEQMKTVMMIEVIDPEKNGSVIEQDTVKMLGAIGNPLKMNTETDGQLYSYKASNSQQTAFSYVVQSPSEKALIRYTVLNQKQDFTLDPFKQMLNSTVRLIKR
ncbi:hypothetical protein [Falsibacillus pallidus]|uniref:Uncharacterized protein n=1 Tax=Falsibacillus pallidus TaxID=493781 RepID=A0A370GW47_9BACI|nr:hypothetical protein [Falsibacillus pallidus]RDI47729.1 hypothetical protein DFR59_101391 [Falsibacillus pallidus]